MSSIKSNPGSIHLAIFDALEAAQLELTPAERASFARELFFRLSRDVEQHYSAADAATLLGRTPEYVVQQIRKHQFARVSRDGGGWLIPASSIQRWLEAHSFDVSGNVARLLKRDGCEA